MDLKKLEDYQYKKYYLPVDISQHKYAELDKREYYLFLFRMISDHIPSFNINNVLYSMYMDKNDKFTSLNKDVYKNDRFNRYDIAQKSERNFCNLEIYIQYTKDNYKFGIFIPKTQDIINDVNFKNYFLKLEGNVNKNVVGNYERFIELFKKKSTTYSKI